MMKKTTLLLIVMLHSAAVSAFDLPFVSLDKAIKSGELVFVGTVNEAAIVSKSPGIIKARANILIEECLVGKSCEKGRVVSMDYYAQASTGTLLPIKFPVGEQVLIVLKAQLQKQSYEFDSDINGGTDFSFVCNAFPYSMLDKHSKFNCKDSLTGRMYKDLSIDQIKEMLVSHEVK